MQKQKIVKRIYYKLFIFAERILSYIIPKKKNVWVYYPTHFKAVAGNVKALFDYVNKNHPDVKQYILINQEYSEGKGVEYKKYCIKRYSFNGLVKALRAKVLLLDSGGSFRFGKFNIIQLWHGTGYKRIAARSHRFNMKRDHNMYKNIKLIPASSEEDKIKKEKSFMSDNVFVTGYPCNDFFYKLSSTQKIKILKENLNLRNFDKIFCYAPTYRDESIFKPFSNQFLQRLQILAEQNNFAFLIKRHPNDKNFLLPINFDNIKDVTTSTVDVQELLLLSDLLISDYSGIACDYSLLNRPIIFYIFDFVIYSNKDRGLLYDLKKILPGPFAYTEMELLGFLDDFSWFQGKQYQHKFKAYRDIFQLYKDGDSSKRVFEKVQGLIKYKGL